MTTPPTLPGATPIKGVGDAVENNQDDPRQGLPSNVNVTVENTPAVLDTTKRTSAKGQYIQYNGVGTVRVMGPDEWAAAGVESDDYFEWNYLNDKRIPRESFSDQQLQYLLRIDDRFELVEINPDSKGDK